MGRTCCVTGCRSRQKDGIPFHSFPSEPEQLLLWIQFCNNPDITLTSDPRKRRICGRHFSRSCYKMSSEFSNRLKDWAVPLIKTMDEVPNADGIDFLEEHTAEVIHSLQTEPRTSTCNFCSNQCTGAFRHVLTITAENQRKLKPILLELVAPLVQLNRSRYPACDNCRRNIITTYNIPESFFQIMPRAEVFDSKADSEIVIFEQSVDDDTVPNVRDALAAEPLLLQPDSEIVNFEQSPYDDTVPNESDALAAQPLLFQPDKDTS